MQIVGGLSNTIDLNSLQGIYRKGGKVAISFEEDTRLGDICSILLTEEYEPEDFREDCLRESFKIVGESLYICKGSLAVVDSISVDENLGALKPFTGKLNDVECLFQLYDTSFDTIADRVVEISGNLC